MISSYSTLYGSQQLAVLMGALNGQTSVFHDDLVAMYEALRVHGLAGNEVLWLEGMFDRPLLLSFLRGVRDRIQGWSSGKLFLYVRAHGFYAGETPEEARNGIELQPAEELTEAYHLFWDEMFDTLSVPGSVTAMLLADH